MRFPNPNAVVNTAPLPLTMAFITINPTHAQVFCMVDGTPSFTMDLNSALSKTKSPFLSAISLSFFCTYTAIVTAETICASMVPSATP